MLHNKRGAALVQVLLITVVLAGMTAMLLRVSLSRANTARRMNQTVTYQMLIGSCQSEINMLWGVKTPVAFARDLSQCYMYSNSRSYTCESVTFEGTTYQVTAKFTDTTPNEYGRCPLTYTVNTL